MPDPNPPAPPAKPAAAPAAPARAIGTEPAPIPQKAVGETDEDVIEVKQLRPYLGEEDKRVMDGKPYSVTRRRAAELHSRGLAEYVDPKDHGRHVEGEVHRASESVRKKYEVKR